MKKVDKKPRKEYIYATTSNEVDSITLSVDPKTGEVTFETEVKDTYSETSYDRPKGPKILSRTPQDSNNLKFDHHVAIKENYDIVFAVDTNTKMIKGHNISVSGIIQAQKIFAVDETGSTTESWQYFTPFCMDFMDVCTKPENLGWMKLIEYIQSEEKYSSYEKIGIIVDSDLENLKSYNSRSTQLFDSFFLPHRLRLIYGTSDAGKDLFANQMLKYADIVSSQCLKELEKGRVPINTNKTNSKYYSTYRRLVPKQ